MEKYHSEEQTRNLTIIICSETWFKNHVPNSKQEKRSVWKKNNKGKRFRRIIIIKKWHALCQYALVVFRSIETY